MNDKTIDFAGLTASAKYLNQQSDSFHNTLEKIEDKIVGLGTGLEVWLTEPEGFVPNAEQSAFESFSYTRGWTIGLTKHGRAWCIATREANRSLNTSEIQLCDPVDNITPLLEAPRERRIAALKLIPALVKKLNAEAKRTANKIDAALEEAKALELSLSDDDIPF